APDRRGGRRAGGGRRRLPDASAPATPPPRLRARGVHALRVPDRPAGVRPATPSSRRGPVPAVASSTVAAAPVPASRAVASARTTPPVRCPPTTTAARRARHATPAGRDARVPVARARAGAARDRCPPAPVRRRPRTPAAR